MMFRKFRRKAQQQRMTTTHEILFYSTDWCGDCRRSKRVFAALDVPYKEINIEQHPDAAEIVTQINNGARSVPTIVFPDGAVLVEPSNATLEAKLAHFTARA